jgi:putative transposase
MHNPTAYLKMRVLGAIDMAEGNTIRHRIKAVSRMSFTDEDGHPRTFTWRTIETWLCRYNKYGITALSNNTRSDKGQPRKVVLEDLQEAIEKVLPKLHGRTPTRGAIYRLCIEEGLLTRSQVAPNTFRRLVKQYEMLKPESQAANKHRLAFAKAHANEMWQADTLYGPYVQNEATPILTRLIAFLDDASRERLGEARPLNPIANDRKPISSQENLP